MKSCSWALALIVTGSALAASPTNKHDPRALAIDPAMASGPFAPLFEGLGDHHHRISCKEEAQPFFDQGLKLTYGFNHQEALRSFKEAARLDADCAMAYWGWALVLGPNLNLPMSDEAAIQAKQAIDLAVTAAVASPRERAYVEALAKRYGEGERAALDQAYADAMQALHENEPSDNDAATLFAASLMNLTPWNYWTRDGRLQGRTDEILALLQGVIERDPEHEGALHYYIHAVEPVDADAGVGAADTLAGLAPNAGHLVHMPSHIYMQVGRYDDAYRANALASKADENYLETCRAQGLYPLNYYPHNMHFMVWAAMMQGDADSAMKTAKKIAHHVPDDLEGNTWGLFQPFLAQPLYVMLRFGQWEELLAHPQPREETPLVLGIWHFGRGLAELDRGSAKRAKKELEALRKVAARPGLDEQPIGFSNTGHLLSIAELVLEGEIAAKRGRYEDAIALLDRAARFEEGLPYNEPPDWYLPVNHTLGAVLIEAGRPDEAEIVYWSDLEEHRDNGYALYGLWKALNEQGRTAEADAVRVRFDEAWRNGDAPLASSRY